jgi:hypothetical protein
VRAALKDQQPAAETISALARLVGVDSPSPIEPGID